MPQVGLASLEHSVTLAESKGTKGPDGLLARMALLKMAKGQALARVSASRSELQARLPNRVARPTDIPTRSKWAEPDLPT